MTLAFSITPRLLFSRIPLNQQLPKPKKTKVSITPPIQFPKNTPLCHSDRFHHQPAATNKPGEESFKPRPSQTLFLGFGIRGKIGFKFAGNGRTEQPQQDSPAR